MARPGGNPGLKKVRNEDTSPANTKRRALAHAYAMSTAEKLLEASKLQSGMTDTQYAEWLNAEGWPTRRGSVWTATQVRRVFRHLGLSKPPRVKKSPQRKANQP
ncbi:hypothetical protein ERT44_14110 [Stenotrophomonas sp. MA5]|nr:hypothetical protein ERT44_14110 [Stenotrophomonas sp. MA5]